MESKSALAGLVRSEIAVSGFSVVEYSRLRDSAGDLPVPDMADDVAQLADATWHIDAGLASYVFVRRLAPGELRPN